MVTLIPLIIILGDPYKISITTKNTLRYIIKKILGIHGSIIIDQTNAVKSESVGNRWLRGSSSTGTSLFLNRTFITLQMGRRETICDGLVYWGP